MTVEVTKDKILNDLDKLKGIIELPDLYLADYFDALRNRVDKECATKQLKLQNDKEKKNELDELWQKMITKIDLFERKCIRKIYDLDENKTRITEIEKKLNNEKLIDLKKVQDEIEKEESNLFQKLFQNKSILFRKHSNEDKTEKKIIDGQLIVLDDEFISQKSIDER
jgi:hypothetical protein